MKFFGTIFILVLFCCCHSKHNDPDNSSKQTTEEKFYAAISSKFQVIDSLKEAGSIEDRDSLDREIVDIIISYKDHVFDLKDSSDFDLVYLAKSKDKKLCMISWDTREGGTMIDFATVLFYKTSKWIIAKYLFEPNDAFGGDSSNTLMHYNTISELHAGDRTIYLAQGFGQGSSALPWEEVRAIEIVNDSIIYPEIFPDYESPLVVYPEKLNNNKLTDAIMIEFDLHYCNMETWRPITQFIDSNKTLKVPKTNDRGGNSDEYFLLKFDGKKFQEVN